MKPILFILFWCVSFSFAQQPATDSLALVLKKADNDIARIDAYNALAEAAKQSDPTRIASYAHQAYALARQIGYREAEGEALLHLGASAIVSGDYRKAAGRYQEAAAVFGSGQNKESERMQKGLARSYGGLGVVFSEQSHYARALEQYFKAARLFERWGDTAMMGRLYNNIGIAFQAQGADFKALDYFLKCLRIQQSRKDPSAGITLTNIGNSYLGRGDLEKAGDYYRQASVHYRRHPNPRGEGELFNNIGLYQIKRKQPDEAEKSFAKAIAAFRSIDDRFGIADTYFHLAQLHREAHRTEAALEAATRSLQLARRTQVKEQIRNAEKLLSELYETKGNPALALVHFREYAVMQDSLNDLEATRNSVRAEMDFEFEKREALRIKEAEKREILYKEQAKRHRLEIVFTVIAVLLLALLAFVVYNRRQLRKTLTLQKELAEYERKALHLQMNPHFVFNCLGSISSFIVQNGTDSAIRYLAKFAKLMRLTLEYSKEALIPIDKEVESLQNYLELERLRFNDKFTFEINVAPEIEDDMALPPLLIQPFVENAIIHGVIPKGENGRITVVFVVENDRLVVTVTDNGVGVDTSREMKLGLVNVHKSMALDIIRKRLSMMAGKEGARIDIEELKDNNGKAAGTRVVLALPIQYIDTK